MVLECVNRTLESLHDLQIRGSREKLLPGPVNLPLSDVPGWPCGACPPDGQMLSCGPRSSSLSAIPALPVGQRGGESDGRGGLTTYELLCLQLHTQGRSRR